MEVSETARPCLLNSLVERRDCVTGAALVESVAELHTLIPGRVDLSRRVRRCNGKGNTISLSALQAISLSLSLVCVVLQQLCLALFCTCMFLEYGTVIVRACYSEFVPGTHTSTGLEPGVVDCFRVTCD
jgi:hypothetical protein